MSKRRGLGGLLGTAALLGAAAAVVSYLYKYEKFSEEVDRDFTDVLDSANEVKDSAKRSYTTLKRSRTPEDLKAVAKDLGYAARNLAIDTKNLAVDAGRDAYRTVKSALDSRFSGEPVDLDAEDGAEVPEDEVEVEFYDLSETEGKDAGPGTVLSEKAEDAAEALKEAASELKEELSGGTEELSEKTGELSEKAEELMEKATATVTEEA